ncbi:hypothetical protein CEXT_167951 [Caerostris extrusa]|uniref:Uncharacterized protein n=1 Tax=Caerostris extrusa TaxID=172846 RepID=A0AAV4VY75_CAEEX|nr:hypothetical protein CEXT_167951 [Caerostris extrusa]
MGKQQFFYFRSLAYNPRFSDTSVFPGFHFLLRSTMGLREEIANDSGGPLRPEIAPSPPGNLGLGSPGNIPTKGRSRGKKRNSDVSLLGGMNG